MMGGINQVRPHNQQANSDLLTDNQARRANQLGPGLLLKKMVIKMAPVSFCDLPFSLSSKAR